MKYLFVILVSLISLTLFFGEASTDYTEKVGESRTLIKEKGFNDKYLILIDYSKHSGKKRMFLYDLESSKIEKSFLVAHGEGGGSGYITPNFSNKVGSNCSSEGFGVLGSRAYSNYGINIKYWIDGLSDTNTNLRKRVVVLHSWGGIPDTETYPLTITRSQGCPTVSKDAMRYLDGIIKSQDNKRILIYSF